MISDKGAASERREKVAEALWGASTEPFTWADGSAERRAYYRDMADAALDELEAMRKPAPCRFDVVAAREELARIDAGWADGAIDDRSAWHHARTLLDRALAAIDAGWPEPAPVDIEGAACAGYIASGEGDAEAFANDSDRYRNGWMNVASAVLAHVGRKVEPVSVTDAQVEEAAIRAWCSGDGSTVDSWQGAYPHQRDLYLREARAVLEYAAALWPVYATTSRRYTADLGAQGVPLLVSCAAAQLTEEQTIVQLATALENAQRRCADLASNGLPRMTIPLASRRYALPIGETRPILCNAHGMTEEQVIHRLTSALDTLAADLQRCVTESHDAPPVDPRAERLTRYRCAAVTGALASGVYIHPEQVEERAQDTLAAEREPAERSPDRG